MRPERDSEKNGRATRAARPPAVNPSDRPDLPLRAPYLRSANGGTGKTGFAVATAGG